MRKCLVPLVSIAAVAVATLIGAESASASEAGRYLLAGRY